MAAGGIGFGRSVGFFLFREGRVLSSVYALATVGPDARVNCETGQVRKEAAISMLGPVPSVARPWPERACRL